MDRYEGHTPGPWMRDTNVRVEAEDMPRFFHVYGKDPRHGCEAANARLIASAPSLLAESARLRGVLDKIVADYDADPDDLETMDRGVKAARAALSGKEGA